LVNEQFKLLPWQALTLQKMPGAIGLKSPTFSGLNDKFAFILKKQSEYLGYNVF
jgi:hypothetical protein